MILVTKFYQFNKSEKKEVYDILLKNCMNRNIEKIIIFVINSTNIILKHPKIEKITILDEINIDKIINKYLFNMDDGIYFISKNNIEFSNTKLNSNNLNLDFNSNNPIYINGNVIYKKYKNILPIKKAQTQLQLKSQLQLQPNPKSSSVQIQEKKKREVVLKRVSIILHLYYQDLWFYFKEKLEKLNYKFDLYVTLSQNSATIGQTEWLKEKIKSFGGKVFIVPNKGLDIGPFLFVLNYIFKKGIIYDYTIKLHSKKSLHNSIGDSWRDDLVNSLIGNQKVFNSNINKIENGNIGMVGSEKWIWEDPDNYDNKYIDYFKDKLLIKSNINKFIGGTMFMVNFNILKKYFIKNSISIYEELEEGYFQDNESPKKTHALERIFGIIVYDSGKSIG